jgi:histidinol-phosphate aminotransferase
MKRRTFIQAVAGLAAGSIATGCAQISSPERWQAFSAARAPGDDGFLHLDRNENPLGPSPLARRAMMQALSHAARYPFREYDELVHALAVRNNVLPESIVLGAGSHEILRMAAAGFCGPGKSLLMSESSYEAIAEYADCAGAPVVRVPPTAEFEPDFDAMANRINPKVGLVYLCNPNNPTGNLIPADRIRNFIRQVPGETVIVVDEAYHDYIEDPGYRSLLEWKDKDPRVIVTRTFSKIYGLAGLRVGYAICRPKLAARLRRNRTLVGVNLLGLRAAIAALGDDDYVRRSRVCNAEAKSHLLAILHQHGLPCVPPAANFVFFKPGMRHGRFSDAMGLRGIRVGRPFPPLLDWCRVTIGTMADMVRFGSALTSVLAEHDRLS